MSGGARVPGSPRRGRRRGRSWSRSRSRSPRGRIVDDVERDRYRSRSRSRDGVHEDDRRDRAGPPGTSRDRSRDASARRERTTLTPTEPDEPDRTNRRSGFGLGYRPEEDGALRAAFGARHLLRSNFSGPRPSARASPSRRAFPAADVSAEPPRSPRPESANASSAYLLTGSLGWRASSGALPRRAETIEGVGDETLAPLAESLRDARETNRRRKETMAALKEKAREKKNGSSSGGFEALELRRAFSVRRVGTRRPRANECSNSAAGFSETTDGPVATATRNRGVADRARADDRADAEAAFAMSANGVRDALAAKAEAYADLHSASLSVTRRRSASSFETLPEKKTGVVFVSSPRATEPTEPGTSVPPPPGYSNRSLDDEKTRAEKRERLIALRNRGRERTTTNA